MDQVSHIVPLLCLTCLIPLAMYLGWRWGRTTALAREEYATALREIIAKQDQERQQLLDRILLLTGAPQAITAVVDRQQPPPEHVPEPEYPPGWKPGEADYLLQGASE